MVVTYLPLSSWKTHTTNEWTTIIKRQQQHQQQRHLIRLILTQNHDDDVDDNDVYDEDDDVWYLTWMISYVSETLNFPEYIDNLDTS